jgi:glycerol-3-phosphate dehydrogenase
LRELASRPFDVIVIGGGINGAGIALEAQLHGYRTLLVERDDFGAGTTSRATRLIHGGLRYLEHAEFALVYESLAEREALLRAAPHLVRPLRLLVPVYRGDARAAWKVRAGLVLYDAFSLRKSLPRHRVATRRMLDEIAPGLNRDGLRSAFTFYDAQVEFPERLVADAVRDFTEAGGTALNHTAATRIISPGGALRSIVLRDGCSGAEGEVAVRVAVNATGPWADELLRGSDAERHARLIGGTKGSHLVATWKGAPAQAIFAAARADGRPFFILPWYGYTLIGTTDLRWDGDPSAARTTPEEVSYLLDEANRLFPATPLSRDDVLYTYCGVRPLPASDLGAEASITRSHFVVDHAKQGGPAGLLSVVGGKLTNYRSLSRIALKAMSKHGRPSASAVGHNAIPPANRTPPAVGPLARYGSRAAEVRALAEAEPALAEPICPHNPDTLAQVAYAADRELARTLGDALMRRLPVGWSACHALDGAARAAGVMAARLGWDPARVEQEVTAYAGEVRAVCVPLADIT